MRVFLTGATGLVGSHVARTLLARGHDVVALVRPATNAAALPSSVQVVRGDILDAPAELSARMRGCAALVHAAAVVYRRGLTPADYERVNVQATDTVLRAAAAAGAQRVVHVSSVAVYSRTAHHGNVEERWLEGELRPDRPYPASKRAGELAAWRVHEEGLIGLTTVRPAVIYGEGDHLLVPLLARIARWPVVPLPEGGRHTVPVVYAGNVATGIVEALERPAAIGQAYNLSDDGALTARSLVQEFAGTLGRSPRVVPVPMALVSLVFLVGDVVAPLVPGRPDPRGALQRLTQDNAFPSAKARRELDWTDGRLLPPAEAVARTAAWWRSMHPETR